MPNFQNGKIYMIRSRSRQDLIYVGSTTQTLSVRMAGHRTPSNPCSSREIIAIGDSYIELIENFPCNSKDELNACENRHMRALQNVINKQSARDDCTHGKHQANCVECHGSCICEHNRIHSICVECHGSCICEHNRIRSTCVECHGSQVCNHNKRRNTCIQCSPIRCEACNKTYSKGKYNRHIRSAKHIANTTN